MGENTESVQPLDASESESDSSYVEARMSQSGAALRNVLTFDESLVEVKLSIDLFFDNQFDKSRNMLLPWTGASLYHTVGNSVYEFMEAVMTIDHNKIIKATNSLKQTIVLCNRYRRRQSFSDTVFRTALRRPSNFDDCTPRELHAELCFAESLLLKSLLSFLQDGTLLRFINTGLKIRSCFKSYRDCEVILESRCWSAEDEFHKIHFESGVKLGIGTFNLVVSLLSPRAVKLLELIGFHGSKEDGVVELLRGAQLTQGLRHPLIVLSLLTYNLVLVHDMSYSFGDIPLCEELLTEELKIYPNGACFLYFRGRLEYIHGNMEEAKKWYIKSWQSQDVWPQLHHLCYWDLIWTHSVLQDWENVSAYANLLLDNSNWSKTVYSYQKASAMLMNENVSEEELLEIEQLMTNLPTYKQTFFAGRSLPFENFCIKKSQRYLAHRNLVLPSVELLYVFNSFKVIGKTPGGISSFIQIIQNRIVEIDQTPGSPFYVDDRAILLLLKGSCLRHMKKYSDAEVEFKHILSMEPNIQEDTYVVPHALFELAIICKERNNFQEAIRLLEIAHNDHTGYVLQHKLDFLIHSLYMDLGHDNYNSQRRSTSSRRSNQPSSSSSSTSRN